MTDTEAARLREILAKSLERGDMHMAAKAIRDEKMVDLTPHEALTAMYCALEEGRADAVAEMEAAGIRLLS